MIYRIEIVKIHRKESYKCLGCNTGMTLAERLKLKADWYAKCPHCFETVPSACVEMTKEGEKCPLCFGDVDIGEVKSKRYVACPDCYEEVVRIDKENKIDYETVTERKLE